jgi:hypothetical protein
MSESILVRSPHWDILATVPPREQGCPGPRFYAGSPSVRRLPARWWDMGDGRTGDACDEIARSVAKTVPVKWYEPKAM